MSFAEMKEQVRLLSLAELEELGACVGLARKARETDWVERAVIVNRAMDAGRAHSPEEFLEQHRKLSEPEA